MYEPKPNMINGTTQIVTKLTINLVRILLSFNFSFYSNLPLLIVSLSNRIGAFSTKVNCFFVNNLIVFKINVKVSIKNNFRRYWKMP